VVLSWVVYPLHPKIIRRHAFGVIKPTIARWHYRLGHPSSSIVCKVISTNKLPCLDASVSESVCDACQKGKIHQLPYPISSTISSVLVELVFSDVWGHAPICIGGTTYYVSLLMILVNSPGSPS
jgi:hypothetical protein